MRPRHTLLLVTLVLTAVTASAAHAQSTKGDRAARHPWHEVERGFYATGSFGATFFFSPPAGGGKAGPLVSGLSMGINVGFDLMPSLGLEAFLFDSEVVAPPSYAGVGGAKDARGDFTALLTGLLLRLDYVHVADGQGIDRLYLDVHAGGGVMLTEPASVFGKMSPSVLGGLGLRYYTRMRHFSAGLDIDGVYGLGLGTIGLYPHASIAYTF